MLHVISFLSKLMMILCEFYVSIISMLHVMEDTFHDFIVVHKLDLYLFSQYSLWGKPYLQYCQKTFRKITKIAKN